ncbi:MAG: hypothetical protein IIA88_08760, partial [Bacteroidetes bacterium]|nr:hypothetical protein [Bacteroidota bacterium]
MAVTFLIPGIIITLVALRKNNIDFIQFLLYALILGLISHTLLSAFSINPLLFLGLLILFTKSYKISWWDKLTQISFSAYDGAVIILTIILLIFISNQVATLPNEYFNPASDQYYWLDQAKNPDSNRGFAYVIASLIPSSSKDFKAQQNFILSWIYFVYALKILA